MPEKPPPSDISIFLKQIKSPLVYILITAGVITFAFQKISDTIVISLSVLVNTILGYFQERRASKALYALKRLIHPATKVLRDNEQKTIDVSQVVCGDVAILNQGSKVPADGKIVEASRLFIEEAILTGESTPVGKKEKDTVFMGTIVTSGQGRMLVESTGAATQIGKIAKSVQEPSEDTPLKRQLSRFSRQLTLLVVILTVLVFFIGLVSRRETLEIFEASVALAVSAIPEGLLVGLTVVLAIGMQRILKRKGLVRNLVSAETLGGVTTICIDKTGTLTEGRLRVVDVIGNNDELIKQSLIANDLDDPIVIAAYEWASKTAENHRFRAENYERLDTIPFSSKDRFFATLARWDEAHNMIFVNGAPEFLARWSNLEGRKLVEINRKIEELSMQGKRVIGFARRKVKTSKVRLRGDDIKDDLEWVGMMAFSDPVRKGVKTALFKAKQAGIKLVVITGDYAQTAISVMHQLGITIKSSEIILGEEVEKLSIPMLTSRLAKDSEVKLFARTTPEQKLNIVKALKLGGEAVAMTGDGVNDAPALKRADIGVVVGDATDVARESADLVLLDSRFETILAAVEEGFLIT